MNEAAFRDEPIGWVAVRRSTARGYVVQTSRIVKTKRDAELILDQWIESDVITKHAHAVFARVELYQQSELDAAAARGLAVAAGLKVE